MKDKIIYIDATDSDHSMYECFTDSTGTEPYVCIKGSEYGEWLPKGLEASVSVLHSDDGNGVTINFLDKYTCIDIDWAEIVNLYFVLDYYFNHSELGNDIKPFKMLKFKEL